MKIHPARYLQGEATLPGDKSISHRAAMLAALASGEMRIENFSSAVDCQTTVKCLRELGVTLTNDGDVLIVKGVGKTGFRKPEKPLDCGNSGTTARLLAGILSGQSFNSILSGDASLSKRPMTRIIDPLCRMGANIGSRNGHMPLQITAGHKLRGIEYEMPVASAQVKSCLLLAGLFADGKTEVIESTPTRDHTERMLRWLGVDVEKIEAIDANRVSVTGETQLTAHDVAIPGDLSSAAYFIIAAACLAGSDILIPNVGLNPTRSGILKVLDALGANLEIFDEREICNEPVGAIRVRSGFGQKAARLTSDIIANIIDEIPVLAVLGTQLEGGMEVRGAGELRHKESDRISTIVEGLRRMNASVEEFSDGFKVERSNLKGSAVDCLADHRIAMALAVAGLLAEGETEIKGSECVDISFPGFFDILGSIAQSK